MSSHEQSPVLFLLVPPDETPSSRTMCLPRNRMFWVSSRGCEYTFAEAPRNNQTRHPQWSARSTLKRSWLTYSGRTKTKERIDGEFRNPAMWFLAAARVEKLRISRSNSKPIWKRERQALEDSGDEDLVNSVKSGGPIECHLQAPIHHTGTLPKSTSRTPKCC